jgi:uncharacterized phage-associated protein
MIENMYQATEIAHFFVRKGIAEGKPLTNMKLLKMVYFAHGLHLAAYDGKPLILDSIEAWQYGPVIPNVYYRYAVFRDALIADEEMLGQIGFYSERIPELTADAQEVIDITWETLSGVNALQISTWTHQQGSAWSKVYEPGTQNISIPNELIRNDFKEFIQET